VQPQLKEHQICEKSMSEPDSVVLTFQSCNPKLQKEKL